jgi:hypothetical protein
MNMVCTFQPNKSIARLTVINRFQDAIPHDANEAEGETNAPPVAHLLD